MAVGSLTAKDEFRNTTDGFIGATVFGPHGEHRGISVEPHGSVWLTEDEQILTANAPRDDKDNPFLPQPYETRNDAGDVTEQGMRPQLELVRRGVDAKNRRPYGVVDDETGAPPEPVGAPAEGSAAAGEEVATPAAPRARRRRTTGG